MGHRPPDGGQAVGLIGLGDIDLASGSAELLYWILSAGRGRGVMAEATKHLSQWAFDDLGLHRLVGLRAATENTASQKVSLKAGFHHEGILRNAGFVHTGRVDLVLFSPLPTTPRPPTTPLRALDDTDVTSKLGSGTDLGERSRGIRGRVTRGRDSARRPDH